MWGDDEFWALAVLEIIQVALLALLVGIAFTRRG
jgi:hypothetical protein